MLLKKLGLSVSDVIELVSMFDLTHPLGLMSAVSKLKETLKISEQDAISIMNQINS